MRIESTIGSYSFDTFGVRWHDTALDFLIMSLQSTESERILRYLRQNAMVMCMMLQ
jgi:hypothetical protein